MKKIVLFLLLPSLALAQAAPRKPTPGERALFNEVQDRQAEASQLRVLKETAEDQISDMALRLKTVSDERDDLRAKVADLQKQLDAAKQTPKP